MVILGPGKGLGVLSKVSHPSRDSQVQELLLHVLLEPDPGGVDAVALGVRFNDVNRGNL